MDTQVLTNTETTSVVETKPGSNLRKVREELGLTAEEVAIQLHLSRSIIDTIEANEFEKLHGATFVRGYLRAYAKLLNLSPEEVIASFNMLYPDTRERAPAPDRNYQHIVLKQKHRTESSVKWIGYAIFVIMVILVLTWWHNHSAVQDTTSTKLSMTAFQTPSTTTTTASSTPATTPQPQAPLANGSGAIPAIGPGESEQAQMTVTNPVAAMVANTVSNVPGMQTDATLSSTMTQQAQQKSIDVTQTTANAAAVPGLSPAPPMVTTTGSTGSATGTKTGKKSSGASVWHNPDDN